MAADTIGTIMSVTKTSPCFCSHIAPKQTVTPTPNPLAEKCAAEEMR
jgi:hypothetical protein